MLAHVFHEIHWSTFLKHQNNILAPQQSQAQGSVVFLPMSMLLMYSNSAHLSTLKRQNLKFICLAMCWGHCTESWHHWRADYWSAHKTEDKRWETHFQCISQHINTRVPDLDLHQGLFHLRRKLYTPTLGMLPRYKQSVCVRVWEPGRSWVLCICLCCFTWTAAVWSVTGASWTYCTWMSGGREEPSTAVAPPSADATAISWAPRST